MCWRPVVCLKKKKPSATGMMDFLLKVVIFIIHGLITKYLDTGEYGTYWADTSGNALISTLIRQSPAKIKSEMEDLLNGGVICTELDEQVIFEQLGRKRGVKPGVLCWPAVI